MATITTFYEENTPLITVMSDEPVDSTIFPAYGIPVPRVTMFDEEDFNVKRPMENIVWS